MPHYEGEGSIVTNFLSSFFVLLLLRTPLIDSYKRTRNFLDNTFVAKNLTKRNKMQKARVVTPKLLKAILGYLDRIMVISDSLWITLSRFTK